jgi:hypothetical protein
MARGLVSMTRFSVRDCIPHVLDISGRFMYLENNLLNHFPFPFLLQSFLYMSALLSLNEVSLLLCWTWGSHSGYYEDL